MPRLSRRVLVSIGVTIGLSILVWVAGTALAEKPEGGVIPGTSGNQLLAPNGGGSPTMSFTYQGRLTEGGVPATGNYDFIIDVYDNSTLGSVVGSCGNTGTGSLLNQPVQNGVFTFYLLCGLSNNAVFTGSDRWLQVQARRTGTALYTILPRQPISGAPYAFSLYPGAIISGTATAYTFGGAVLNVNNSNLLYNAIFAQSASGSATRSESVNGNGLYGYTENGYGVYGYDGGTTQAKGYAGYFHSQNGVGVFGESNGTSTHPNIYSPGVYGVSQNGVGVYGRSAEATATGTSAGVMGYGVGNPGGKFYSFNGNLIEGWEDQNGDMQTQNLRFKVSYTGTVYADGPYYGAAFLVGSADFAEMMPAGQAELEPGDVLAIGTDGRMVRSSQPFQVSVAGIYSTKPGFVAGKRLDEAGNPLEPGRIPLAVVGVVPVKVTAENGAIHPGDLLTTSSTAGHAMKAGANPPAGTIIGKALEALEQGQGVIQVLVTLQ